MGEQDELSEATKRFMQGLGVDFEHSKLVGHICTRCGRLFKSQKKFDEHPCPRLAKQIIKDGTSSVGSSGRRS